MVEKVYQLNFLYHFCVNMICFHNTFLSTVIERLRLKKLFCEQIALQCFVEILMKRKFYLRTYRRENLELILELLFFFFARKSYLSSKTSRTPRGILCDPYTTSRIQLRAKEIQGAG